MRLYSLMNANHIAIGKRKLPKEKLKYDYKIFSDYEWYYYVILAIPILGTLGAIMALYYRYKIKLSQYEIVWSTKNARRRARR